MTFVEGFYSFNIEITHIARSVYEKIRIKTPRHPHESLQHLYARILAFIHAYKPGQVFSRGFFEPDEPAIWEKDTVGQVELWIEVGCPPIQKIRKALRHWPEASFGIYFFGPEQARQFCSQLRGSRENWLNGLRGHSIDPGFLESILPLSRSSSNWHATIVDETIYLTIDGHEFETCVPELDVWREYQSILTAAELQ